MKKRLLFLNLSLVMIMLIASSPAIQQIERSLDQNLQKITKRVTTNGWVYFNDNFKPDPYEFFSKYKAAFNLSEDDEMRLSKEGKDSIFNYFKFERYYKGIKVEGSGKTLKFKDKDLQVVIGRPLIKIEIDPYSRIDPKIALEAAQRKINASKYAWEDTVLESAIKKETNDSSATWYPKADLVITRTPNGVYRLAYKFSIMSILPKFENSVQYIDANNGTYIKTQPLQFNGSSPCITWYYGEQIITNYFAQGHWWLTDHDRPATNITAKSSIYPTNYNWNSYDVLEDWDDYWNWESERSEVSAMWAVQKAWDYFQSLDWWGTDNQGRGLSIGTEYPYNNSGYLIYSTYDYMYFGYRDGHSLTSLDIVGHEFTHGVLAYINGVENVLEYTASESGALSESYCDFFGERIEKYALGDCDWITSAEADTVRSFITPSYRNQPEYYYGDRWSYSQVADIYVHTNSGVPNHMFYLLSEGDSGYDITGVGISLAATIAFNALDWYLESDASFTDARDAFLDVALDYGDECYYIYKDVMNAWAAVGVGDPAPELCMSSVYFSGPLTVCPSSTEYTITNLPTGCTISWTCSQNITRISSQGSNPCQFEANASGENGWIDATITYNGNQYPMDQISVWVGSDLQTPVCLSITGEYYEFVEHTNDMWELCPNTNYLLRASTSSGISQWDWSIPESWELLSDENSPEVLIQTGDYIIWEDEVHIDVLNSACGTWLYYADYLLVTEPPYGIGCEELLKLNLYPNPASNSITLQISENGLTRDNKSNYNISIVDKSGRVTINKITKGNLHNIDISNLPNGEYTVVISKGRSVNSLRFIKSN